MVDGSLFPLAFQPQTINAPDFSGRIDGYSLTVSTLIVSNDQCLIRYFLSGWPGSAHDNRIFQNLQLCLHPQNYFAENQYLLADSAYENNWFLISAYHSPPGHQMPPPHTIYNFALSKACVIHHIPSTILLFQKLASSQNIHMES
jgi:DDE superfamily endonuclease